MNMNINDEYNEYDEWMMYDYEYMMNEYEWINKWNNWCKWI